MYKLSKDNHYAIMAWGRGAGRGGRGA